MPSYYYDHVHLISPNPLKTAQFYEEMFNAKRVSVKELSRGGINVELDLNGSRVLVMSPSGGSAPSSTEASHGLGHFGIRTDDLETAVADLKAKGVKFKEEMRVASSGAKVSFLWAPENVLIELLERSK
ncbi:hypothetical protein ES708_13090 [subsurface metagenome]